MEIRMMRASEDPMAISRVFEESWRFAYRGLIPQEFLDSIPEGHWADGAGRADHKTLLLTDGEEIAGVVYYGASRFEAFPGMGEIMAIYLRPAYIGQGWGYALLCAALEKLREQGFTETFLWVLEGNERAIRFYEREGFAATEHVLGDNIGGRNVNERQYRRKL